MDIRIQIAFNLEYTATITHAKQHIYMKMYSISDVPTFV